MTTTSSCVKLDRRGHTVVLVCSIGNIEVVRRPQFGTALIREATDWLSSKGHVYPTIDDNHF